MGGNCLALVETASCEEFLPNDLGAALVIADRHQLLAKGCNLPNSGGIHFAEAAQLSAVLLQRIMPEIVLSPLIAVGFDASDIASRLARLGFRGAYRVLTTPLPDCEMVLSELRMDAPDVDIDLLVLDGSTMPS